MIGPPTGKKACNLVPLRANGIAQVFVDYCLGKSGVPHQRTRSPNCISAEAKQKKKRTTSAPNPHVT